MKTITELELELALAKLDKMTSTVKQLGTKLKEANQSAQWASQESDHYLKLYTELNNKVSSLVLSTDECHERAIKINNRNF
jgi:chromosome segregation ATPase